MEKISSILEKKKILWSTTTVALVLLSSMLNPIALTNTANAATIGTCQDLPVSSIKASGDDGNVAANTLDDNFDTRWSAYGKGSWIMADLATTKTICYLDMAWYKGDIRSSNFAISVSSDGSTFKTVYSGKSSGTTTNFERYDFADTAARFVKITISGNTQNLWASITEIAVFGYSSDVTPPSIAITSPVSGGSVGIGALNIQGSASDNVGGSGVTKVEVKLGTTSSYSLAVPKTTGDWSTWTASLNVGTTGQQTIYAKATDLSGNYKETSVLATATSGTDSGSGSGSGTVGTDKFGIKMLIPTVSNGREWVSKWNNGITRSVVSGDPYDPEFHPSGDRTKMYVTGDQDGSLEVRGDWPRFNIMDPAKVKMWKNVEVTYYVKVVNQNQGTDDKGIAAEARDGDFGPSPDGYQLGYSYNHALRYNGRVFFQKEVADHCLYTSGVKTTYPWSTSDGSLPMNQWIGVKYIVRNTNSDTGVYMALYIDKTNGLNGGDWQKLIEYTDSGGWKASPTMDCSTTNLVPNRPPDWVILNATYDIRFRSDYAEPVLWKNTSIREISPLS